jgi:hypothetical protein
MEDIDRRRTAYEEVMTADQTIERLADKLQQLADRSASEGGPKAKLAQPLADDAEFLRKLKPSLIKARIQGRAATNGRPRPGRVQVSAPRTRPKRSSPPRSGGPNPWLVAGACFVAGIAVAKMIDWRGHAHPRD